MTTLAAKIVSGQMDTIGRVWNDNIDFDAHMKLNGTEDHIFFTVQPLQHGNNAYKFTVKTNDAAIIFTMVSNQGEYMGCDIKAMGLYGDLTMLLDAATKLTMVMYRQLVKYAEVNHFPPENLMH